MKQIIKKELRPTTDLASADFFGQLWEESWTYLRTVVDVVREPVLILDKDFVVMAANGPFYHTFQVEPKETEGKIVYDLGNGQWDIPALRVLLEKILPKNTFFKGFEVVHEFPYIGQKIMLLNARQIYFSDSKINPKLFPPIILLAMEDVTEIMMVAETLAHHTNQLEVRLAERTQKLEIQIEKLSKEISSLKNK